jgi:hypothetical protein
MNEVHVKRIAENIFKYIVGVFHCRHLNHLATTSLGYHKHIRSVLFIDDVNEKSLEPKRIRDF